jgi:hypothetical protein
VAVADDAKSEAEKEEARRRAAAEWKRQWKLKNPDKVKKYREEHRSRDPEAWRKKHRDQERARLARKRAEEAQREAVRQRARDWYAENSDRHLEYQRQYRARKRAEDPEGYREAKKERNKRWRDAHRDAENAKLRQKYRDNPEAKQQQASRYYATHAEDVKARRRAYYAAHREKELEKQRQWREREKRRRDAGLPPRRIHRVLKAERIENTRAAETFFTKTYTPVQLDALRQEGVAPFEEATPPELYEAWVRDCERARAAYRNAHGPSRQPDPAATRRAAERAREEERLYAIARAINDQLRHGPRPTHPHPGIGDAPTTPPATQHRGMTR